MKVKNKKLKKPERTQTLVKIQLRRKEKSKPNKKAKLLKKERV